MKRWTVECNHGCRDEPMARDRGDKWHGVGPIDPARAILIVD